MNGDELPTGNFSFEPSFFKPIPVVYGNLILTCGDISLKPQLHSQEAKSLISQRSFNPRDIFKQKEQSFAVSNIPAASRPGKEIKKHNKADINNM